ncbi:EAL domain, c-di-GMP-specific phosphodiesterase class I (or its enzymatically inactive variant) [Pseudoxanthomonas sp. GM95]|uniref:EAL domain-containing protein n=1 Tax=Pseudoxanthomonas sp. GM95 TaxID=1881043 RepID=UPI0008AC80F7|nr:GGDEF domain-containing phosphodiesterase [Pseudoxanthomonas sp. GM95]SEL67755.1 EAL domain, c-di-GMP-specific phosphodiesterase class I (or its enzymatically inactive variant) [Pseudoxanthomonas sp. GM95]
MGERQLSLLKTTLLLGVLGLLLQRVTIGYPSFLSRATEMASLVHLQAGLLLAVAMLFRQTRVVAGVFGILFLGWIVDWLFFMGGRWQDIVVGAVAYTLLFGWTLACARLMGWPREGAAVQLQLRDLPPFVGVGLLLYPVGIALIGWLASWQLFVAEERLPVTVEVFFAKLFGVLVVTLPLVTGWAERRTPVPRSLRISSFGWLLVLVLAVAASYTFEHYLRAQLGLHGGRALPLMDFRFVLFVLLGVAVIRLRYPVAMALLSASLLLVAYGAANAATASNTPLGFINLLHIAVELGVLQVAMLYLLIILRNGRANARRLDEETRRDTVTGLPNLKALRSGAAAQPRAPTHRQLGYLVLDRTEDLISVYGLDVQAEVMTQAAGRLGEDVQAFVVGTGQLVVLPTASADMADCWDRLMAGLQHVQIQAGGGRFRLLPYLGVAAFDEDTQDALESAVRSASQLAFQARHNSELNPLLHDPEETRVGAWQTVSGAADALALLRNDQVELHFQPIQRLDPATGAIDPGQTMHGEVLCRLRDDDGTLLMPGAFLPQVEAVGRGAELDLAVVRTLFAQLAAQPQAVPRFARLSVNLTGQSLASAGFGRKLLALMDSAPIPGSQLIFEITETAAILQASTARELLDRLRERGCLIAIDDFGVGMQSFERLKTLPVDMIKIDGSFVRNVAAGGKDHAVVQACVAVAQAFGAQTVAEFVEDTRTAECLHALGVDWVQGYLISPPRPLQPLLEQPTV